MAGLRYDPTNDIRPCVHSFRHTYVQDKIFQWHRQGRDVNLLIPYLSAQLGHSSINATYQYCMRLDTKFDEIFGSMASCTTIVPEVRI